ncbi:O-fucosyltransferase family protein [Leeuwenhoekiella palythoae]|uniref:Nodulation protein Z (NodZ) n=1 Tax=Leeuwenhoekiella palythoae TaxID=573501 RepID=A0A1M5Z0U8_9FLAO|nr:hypothetical protein [Leeuwenhoekiella palythoae]RXG29762.1 hypothetical protein DSM01_1864 [Leeuwenhoekiella palythoae]SHI17876.1 hypothetical protein SAMN04487999_2587 [Leeuwenhoekiella palythoae]
MSSIKQFLNTAYQRVIDYYFNLRLQCNQQLILKNKSNGIFAVEVFSKMGFGANFIWLLEILEYCDSAGLKPFVIFRNPSKRIGSKSFSEFVKFKNDSQKPFFLHYAVMRSFKELGLNTAWNYNSALTLERANYLLNKYLKIDAEVTEFVHKYSAIEFKANRIIGVHFRGTDKIAEAPAVSYEQVKKVLLSEFEKESQNIQFFLASDDHTFIDYMTLEFEENQILCRTINRSKNGKPIHITAKNHREVNREALIDCLILAKCDKLIKTASILSGCSVVFNPNLEVEMLNEPYPNYRFFPEKLFLK